MSVDAEHAEPLDLQKSGLLWLINRVTFHPRGFALAIHPDGSLSMLGDGSEVWSFKEEVDDEYFALAEETLNRCRS